MNARQRLHQIHLQEWTVRFAEQKASGLTVRQWCEQNNLSFHTYNYWKHLLKEDHVSHVLFTASRRFLSIFKRRLKLCTALFLFRLIQSLVFSFLSFSAFQP